jgi:glycosyltransferase involved in cell wall biosynthesis
LIVLGWGGSLSHVDSWLESGIIPALDNVFTDYPQARLKFCGHEDRLDDLVFKRWGDRVIKHWGVKPEDWPLVISTFDIGLAPLDTRPLDPPWREGAPIAAYDERRSWLKAAEYLCAGVPYAATRSRTYEDLNGRGHMVINGVDNWTATLTGMVRNLAEEKRAAWHTRKWALNKLTFEANVNRYSDIVGRMQAAKYATRKIHLPGITYIDPKPVEVKA